MSLLGVTFSKLRDVVGESCVLIKCSVYMQELVMYNVIMNAAVPTVTQYERDWLLLRS